MHTHIHSLSSVSVDWLAIALCSDLLREIERFQEVSQLVLARLCCSLQVRAHTTDTHTSAYLMGEQVKAFLRKYTTKTTSITSGDGGHKSEGLQPQSCFNTLTVTLSDALSSNTCFLVFDTSNSDPHYREIIAGMFSAGKFLSSHGIKKFLNVNHMNAMFKIVKLKVQLSEKALY